LNKIECLRSSSTRPNCKRSKNDYNYNNKENEKKITLNDVNNLESNFQSESYQNESYQNSIFVPNHLSLFYEGEDDIEVQKQTAENKSGESIHEFILKITDNIRRNHDNLFLESLEDDINNSHISTRETLGGIQVVTCLQFLNGKLGDLFIGNISYDCTKYPERLYVLFFIKSILYMTNYYFFVRNESDIRIQKDAFQSIFGGAACTSYKRFLVIFQAMEKYLKKIGILGYLFKYNSIFDHYVLQEAVFLSLNSYTEIDIPEYSELKVRYSK